jgi:hypothetical protein
MPKNKGIASSAGERKSSYHPLVQRIWGLNGLIVPRNPIFWKNRISQTVPKRAQKMKNCPRNPIFWKNRISQTVPKHAQKNENRGPRNPIFWKWKNRISQPCPNVPKK